MSGVETVADGELRVDIEHVKESEIGVLAQGLKKIKYFFQAMISLVKLVKQALELKKEILTGVDNQVLKYKVLGKK